MEIRKYKVIHSNLQGMQHDNGIWYILGAIYAFTAYLMLYQIEIRFKPLARLKCRFGYHRRIHKELGKIVSQYRCVHCNKPKDHPHLKVVEGGKKDLGTPFKF